MNDEQEAQSTPEETTTPEADRFEVKWRKKNEPKPSTPQPEPGEDLAGVQRQLREEQERTKNLQERWQRAAADLANLKRRTEQERGDLEKFAGMLLVQELLPVLDNFERALATIPGNLEMLTWIQGIMLIERHLRAILERQGLQAIETAGQTFNPHLHEAVTERPTAEAAPGTIVQEYQRGYTMHGRLLRPALVEVAAAPSEVEETTPHQAEQIAQQAETENVGP